MRYSSPYRDISSFKRSFLCIMRADRSAHVFQRRNKPRHKRIAIIRRFCPNLCVIPLPVEIFRRLNTLFTALCVQIVVHAFSIVETRPDTRKSQSFVDLYKFMRYSSPNRDISSFKRSFHCIMRAGRSV